MAKKGLGCVLGCGIVAGAVFLIGSLGLLIIGGVGLIGGNGDAATGDEPTYNNGLNTDDIPAEVVPWIEKAASTCKPVTAPLIAAQLYAESGIDPDTEDSPAGAQGIAQFMPRTWDGWGFDADNNGVASPYDIGDAVMSQAKYMCYLWRFGSKFPGPELDLALAGYNAGPGNVELYNGVPPFEETVSYIALIKKTMKRFTAADTGAVTLPLERGVVYTNNDNWGASGPNWTEYHTGVDYSAATGEPVVAATDGTVVLDSSQSSWAGPYFVKVVSVSGLATWYAHMDTRMVMQGQQVEAGQQIGTVGVQGNVTGPHLHFEVHPQNGSIYEDNIDPNPWLADHNVQVCAPDTSCAAS